MRNKNYPTVSIIIPVRNEEMYVQECLTQLVKIRHTSKVRLRFSLSTRTDTVGGVQNIITSKSANTIHLDCFNCFRRTIFEYWES